MLLVQHYSRQLGYFWRPAAISSKLNLVEGREPWLDAGGKVHFAAYTPVKFR